MRNGDYAYLTILMSHGLTAAISVYLAVRGGNWLDKRLGTSPLFLALLVLLVIGANLRMLIRELMAEADRRAGEGRGEAGGGSRGQGSEKNPEEEQAQ